MAEQEEKSDVGRAGAEAEQGAAGGITAERPMLDDAGDQQDAECGEREDAGGQPGPALAAPTAAEPAVLVVSEQAVAPRFGGRRWVGGWPR